jgi:hypothetical protein
LALRDGIVLGYCHDREKDGIGGEIEGIFVIDAVEKVVCVVDCRACIELDEKFPKCDIFLIVVEMCAVQAKVCHCFIID